MQLKVQEVKERKWLEKNSTCKDMWAQGVIDTTKIILQFKQEKEEAKNIRDRPAEK